MWGSRELQECISVLVTRHHAWISLACKLSNQNNEGKVAGLKQPALCTLHPPLPTFVPCGLHRRLQLYLWSAVYVLMSTASLSHTLSVTQIQLPVKCPVVRLTEYFRLPHLYCPQFRYYAGVYTLGMGWHGLCTHDVEK